MKNLSVLSRVWLAQDLISMADTELRATQGLLQRHAAVRLVLADTLLNAGHLPL